MSAVIVQFPSNARAVSARRRAVKQAIDERATQTKATPLERQRAFAAAVAELDRGGSAGLAIQKGWNELPRYERQGFRQPTDPRPAA